jgi:hypothetical protein
VRIFAFTETRRYADMSICSTSLSEDEGRLVVKPNRAMHMLDCSRAKLYQLINAKELESFTEGTSRKIMVQSIRAYIARRLESSAANQAA